MSTHHDQAPVTPGIIPAFLGRLRQAIEEPCHLVDTQLARVALAVEADEALAPIGDGRCSGFAVSMPPCGVADVIEQPWRLRDWQHIGRSGTSTHSGPPLEVPLSAE